MTWKFLAEGHLNAVFSNSKGQIIRCRKKYISEKRPIFEIVSIQQTYDYYHNVIVKIIPNQYLPKMELLNLDQCHKKNLAADIQKFSQRGDNPTLMRDEAHCLLMDDASYLSSKNNKTPTLAIEIKPKCGFILDPKIQKSSRFQLQQRLKLKEGSRQEISKYCPLDFYAGDVETFTRSITNLIETPQNNLRAFKDEILVFDHNIAKDIDDFSARNQKFLEIFQDNLDKNLNSIEKISSLLFDCLKNPLEILLNLQKLDRIGSRKALSLLENMQNSDKDQLQEYNGAFWKSIVDNIGSRNPDFDFGKYLISNTFKDCSIMIAIAKVKDNGNFSKKNELNDDRRECLIEKDGQRYVYKVTLVDFDPKPIGKIKRYTQLHDSILAANGLDRNSIILI